MHCERLLDLQEAHHRSVLMKMWKKSMRTGAAQTEEKTNGFGRHRGVKKSCRVHCRAYSGVFGSHLVHLLQVNRQM